MTLKPEFYSVDYFAALPPVRPQSFSEGGKKSVDGKQYNTHSGTGLIFLYKYIYLSGYKISHYIESKKLGFNAISCWKRYASLYFDGDIQILRLRLRPSRKYKRRRSQNRSASRRVRKEPALKRKHSPKRARKSGTVTNFCPTRFQEIQRGCHKIPRSPTNSPGG